MCLEVGLEVCCVFCYAFVSLHLCFSLCQFFSPQSHLNSRTTQIYVPCSNNTLVRTNDVMNVVTLLKPINECLCRMCPLKQLLLVFTFRLGENIHTQSPASTVCQQIRFKKKKKEEKKERSQKVLYWALRNLTNFLYQWGSLNLAHKDDSPIPTRAQGQEEMQLQSKEVK